VTSWVIADWITRSVAVSSLSRCGLRRDSVCSTDSVVKLSRPVAGSRMNRLLNSSITVVSSPTSSSAALALTTRRIVSKDYLDFLSKRPVPATARHQAGLSAPE
jgi:hypothetical protein